MMGVKIRLDARALAKLDGSVLKATEMTVEALRTDVLSNQVMPYNVGTMQNDNTFTDVWQDGETIRGALVTGSPQARRLYFHPEYNYQKKPNENAGGEWLEPWINGDKKDFVKDTFQAILNKEAGL